MIGAVLAFAAAAGSGAGLRALGHRIGAVDRPDRGLKPHPSPVPYLGGIAVSGGLAATLAIDGWRLPWTVTAAAAGALALGLADDALLLPAWVRLAGQGGLGAVVVSGGLRADVLPDGPVVAWVGSVLAIVAAMNAVNMVDGMDGLAGGAAVLSAAGVALVCSFTDHRALALFVAWLAAATTGFLLHNLPRARLFLGDNGAYLLGASLAAAIVAGAKTPSAFLGAGTCMGLFALDLILALLRRARRGARLMAGDRGHVYDQLRARGLSQSGTLAVSWSVHLAFVVAGVGISRLSLGPALVAGAGVWVVAVAGLAWSGFISYRGQPA